MSATIRAAERHATYEVPAVPTSAVTLSRVVVLTGRILFSLIFLQALPGHFSSAAIGYAAQAGIPFAGVLVPLSGVLAGAGGLSVALGYRTRIGAMLLAAFLVPVTLSMHAFWAVSDPMMAQLELAMFLKNAGLLGGALLLSQFGAGPLSFDARRQAASPAV